VREASSARNVEPGPSGDAASRDDGAVATEPDHDAISTTPVKPPDPAEKGGERGPYHTGIVMPAERGGRHFLGGTEYARSV
jgi:hypothetical protein